MGAYGGDQSTLNENRNTESWKAATGIFFHEQSVEALEAAVKQFLAWEGRFRPEVLRRNAGRFSRERFKREISAFVAEKWREFSHGK